MRPQARHQLRAVNGSALRTQWKVCISEWCSRFPEWWRCNVYGWWCFYFIRTLKHNTKNREQLQLSFTNRHKIKLYQQWCTDGWDEALLKESQQDYIPVTGSYQRLQRSNKKHLDSKHHKRFKLISSCLIYATEHVWMLKLNIFGFWTRSPLASAKYLSL